MANYDRFARSNGFRIKSLDAFVEELNRFGIAVELDGRTIGENTQGQVGIVTGDKHPDGSQSVTLLGEEGWPGIEGDGLVIGIEGVVHQHLVEDQVAVFIEIGMEKLAYLGGTGLAINAHGETRTIHLDDIMDLAQELAPKEADIDEPWA